jgi:uncharacterized protein (DUF433 family)
MIVKWQLVTYGGRNMAVGGSSAFAPWKRRLTIPAYTLRESAKLCEAHPRTVAAWHRNASLGRQLLTDRQSREALSYLQLIEAAVVAAMRRRGISMLTVRRARAHLGAAFETQYPFAMVKLKTDGAHLLYEWEMANHPNAPQMAVADKEGQYVWSNIIADRLHQFEYDPGWEFVARWYPRGHAIPVAIDPRICFGQPQIQGVRTSAIRMLASRKVLLPQIADEFDLSEEAVVAALQFEGLELG